MIIILIGKWRTVDLFTFELQKTEVTFRFMILLSEINSDQRHYLP